MVIKLYKYTGIPQIINKTPTLVTTLNGEFRQPLSLMNPVIEIAGQQNQDYLMNNGCNYVEINNMFYYIMDVTATHLMTTIVLHMDVLNSYKDEINKMEVMLERSSNSLELDVVDSQYPLASNKLIETIDLPIGFSELEEDGTYILVTSQNLYTGVDAE